MPTKSDYGLGVLYHGTPTQNRDTVLREGLTQLPIWLAYYREDAYRSAMDNPLYTGSAVVFSINLPDDWELEKAAEVEYLSWKLIPCSMITEDVVYPSGSKQGFTKEAVMKFNVIGYNNQRIGQVEAANQIEAWEKAKEYDNVLDVREAMQELKHPELLGQIVTFYESLDRWLVIGETEIPTLSGFITKIRIRRILPKPEVEGLADPEDLIIS